MVYPLLASITWLDWVRQIQLAEVASKPYAAEGGAISRIMANPKRACDDGYYLLFAHSGFDVESAIVMGKGDEDQDEDGDEDRVRGGYTTGAFDIQLVNLLSNIYTRVYYVGYRTWQ